jgi:hypothetical protein
MNMHIKNLKRDRDIADPITSFYDLLHYEMPHWLQIQNDHDDHDKTKNASSSSTSMNVYDKNVIRSILHNIETKQQLWKVPTPIQTQSTTSILYTRRQYIGCYPTATVKLVPSLY